MDALKWDDLHAFLAVARTGTLAAAAADLGVNASTVHRRMAALEASLGTTLFDRDPRGYALTGVGEALLPRAVEVEEAVLAARRAATGHDQQARGPVRVTLADDLLDVVAPHLAAFHDAHPGIEPVLLVDPRPFDLGREADVALRPSDTPPDAAIGHRVAPVAWCRYAPAHDPEDDLPWAVYEGLERAGAVRWRLRHHPDVPVLLRVSSVAGMQRVLRCTRATGLLPCHVGDPDTRLRRVGAPIPEAATTLWLLVHADLRRSARVRAFVDFLLPRLRADTPRFAGG
ncbi:MAG: LysR family transcriptional regulator [Alphaproteobacteria bacterium]|nr:LysR family transcriptional regulator [Alphaproteobacteria bacterium]